MNKLRISGCVLLGLFLLPWPVMKAATLHLESIPVIRGEPLVLDTNSFTLGNRRAWVIRLDYLLSNLQLRASDGHWIPLQPGVAFLSARSGTNGVTFGQVPDGTYDRLRFQVGLSPQLNYRDPATLSPKDPLLAAVNGLHRSTAEGYTFLALEGIWQAGAPQRIDFHQPLYGFSFHLATDAHPAFVELAVKLTLVNAGQLTMTLDLDTLFPVAELEPENSWSYAHSHDPFSRQFAANLAQAFRLKSSASKLTQAPAP